MGRKGVLDGGQKSESVFEVETSFSGKEMAPGGMAHPK
jgi:hypothetical protein